MKNTFLSEMNSRGFLNQCTDLEKLEKISSHKSIKAYIGFDITAPSLHVGSLMQIMILRLLQKYGHQPIVLLGGGTTLIGDPSGKDTTRKILTNQNIKKNISTIKKIFEKLLFSKNKKTKPVYVNNYNWLGKLKYIDFLRDVGKHFTINKMLTFDSVKLRLEREQSLSYMEFNYMILQAYDFLELNQKAKCELQIGGSDQWGNIVNGVELIKRHSDKEVFGLTTPLITLSSGAKMGKTAEGAIWLDKNFLSAYDYWQFWRNTDDRDVIRFLKFFTEVDLDKIEILKNKNINQLKILLANKTTQMLHGKKESMNAEKIAKETFSENSSGSNLPSFKIQKSTLDNKMNIIDLIILSGLENSKSEVRRLINGNAIKIDNEIVKDQNFQINQGLLKNNFIKLSIGKKRHLKIEIN